jgi:hypothetical protein
MRDREQIEREMFRTREDLEQNLDELKHVVREKIDIPARARAAAERGKQQAVDLAKRGADGAKRLAVRSKDFTKERPVLVGGILAGLIAGLVATVLILRHRNRTWFDRLLDAI